MAKMKGDEHIVVPARVTVGFRQGVQPNTKDFPLAFATPVGTDKAYEKRLDTVKNWCSVGYQKFVMVKNSAEEYKRTGDYWQKGADGKYIQIPNPVPPLPEAVMLDLENVPTKGFAVDDVRSRYSTDNKVFNIKDPRGFTLQVYSDNFMNLILNDTIEKGVFQGEYVWGRYGGKWFLMSTSDPLYETSLEFKKKEETWTYPKVGDTFKDGLVYAGDVYVAWVSVDEYDPTYRKLGYRSGFNHNKTHFKKNFDYRFNRDQKPWHILTFRMDKYPAIKGMYTKRKFSKKNDLVVESSVECHPIVYGVLGKEDRVWFNTHDLDCHYVFFKTREEMNEWIADGGFERMVEDLKVRDVEETEKQYTKSYRDSKKRWDAWIAAGVKPGYGQKEPVPYTFEHVWTKIEPTDD